MAIVKHLEDQGASAFQRFGTYDYPECLFQYKYGSNFLEILREWNLWGLDLNHAQLKAVFQAMRKVGFRKIENGCPTHQCHPSRLTPEEIATQFFADYADNAEQGLQHLCMRCLKAGEFQQECSHKDDLGAFSA